MARIVLVSQRLLGHALPAAALGAELKRRGHEVTMFGNQANRALIEGAGLQFAEIGWDKYPDLYADRMLEELLPQLEKIEPDLLLNDSAQCAPSYSAELLGLRQASFQTSVPLAEPLLPGGANINAALRKAYAKELNRVRARFGLSALEEDSLRTRGDCAGISDRLHLVTVLPELADGLAELQPQTRLIGPCDFVSESEADPAEARALIPPGDKPLVLATATSVPRAEYRIATDRYIRVCLEAFAGGSCRLIVSEQRPYKGGRPLPDHIRWTTYQPIHRALLPHTDALITHGGCGTLQTAMYHGVPMAIVPLGADHPLLAERCCKLGLAVVLDTERLDAQQIRRALNELTSDTSYRMRAAELSARLQTRTPVRAGVDYLERLLPHHPIKEAAL